MPRFPHKQRVFSPSPVLSRLIPSFSNTLSPYRSFSASSLSSSSAGIHTARQGVPHPCGPVQPHIAFAPDSPALQLQNLRSCQGFGQSSFQLSRWAFPFLPVCNFDKRMYARILTCVGIMTHVRRTFLPIPSMGDPEHTHPDSESRCSIISIVTFSGGSSSTCRDRSCRIWGSAAVPLIAALIDNHASVSSSIGLS